MIFIFLHPFDGIIRPFTNSITVLIMMWKQNFNIFPETISSQRKTEIPQINFIRMFSLAEDVSEILKISL